ncbi:MAG: cation transporter [Lachnospiraceae bacterium]|nr:cation transporter [Lachnospiraceae bacterium]
MSGKKEGQSEFEYESMRVSRISLIVNAMLSVFKLIAGIVAHSGAMISDSIHSATDVFSTFIVMIGVKMASKAADKEHPYGHERLECVASIVLAVVLFETGLGIGTKAVSTIRAGQYDKLVIPGVLALVAAAVSIVSKEWMYQITIKVAKKINSSALKADAWHHRSDSLSSIGALIGIGGARLGYPIADTIASLFICLFIVKAAYDIFMDAIDKMVDKACDDALASEMMGFMLSQEGVIDVNVLKTRMFGARIYVEAEIEVDGELRLRQSHAIAHSVHDAMEKRYPAIKHIMIHVNPTEN